MSHILYYIGLLYPLLWIYFYGYTLFFLKLHFPRTSMKLSEDLLYFIQQTLLILNLAKHWNMHQNFPSINFYSQCFKILIIYQKMQWIFVWSTHHVKDNWRQNFPLREISINYKRIYIHICILNIHILSIYTHIHNLMILNIFIKWSHL